MKINETVNEITFKETPGCLWFFGLFFVISGGMMIWGTLGGFSNWNEVPAWELTLAFFVALSVVAAGVWQISQAPVQKVVINRIENTVSMTKYDLSGKSSVKYSFDEISKFCLIEGKDSEDVTNWTLGMILESGETIEISSMPTTSEEFQLKYVFQINSFMRKQMPSFETNIKIEY